MELLTDRLILKPCDSEILEGLIQNNLTSRLQINISKNWPLEDIKDALPVFLQWLKDGTSSLGFGMWLMILKEENIVIGGTGFVCNPDENGVIELGYSIAPEFRGRKLTTEACKGLIQWAFGQEKVKTIIAKCEKQNIASIKVLENLKMQKSEKDDMFEWSLAKDL